MTKRWLLLVCRGRGARSRRHRPRAGSTAVPAQLQDVRPGGGGSRSRHRLTRAARSLRSPRQRPRARSPTSTRSRTTRATASTAPATYVSGTWTSGVTNLSFGFNELVSSWNANTPPAPGSRSRCSRRSTTATGPSGTSSGAGRPTTTRSTAPRSAARATPTASSRSTPSSRRTILAIAYRLRATPLPEGRRLGRADAQPPERDRLEPDQPEEQLPEQDDDDRHRGRPRRPAVLAGDPPRRLPAVRQRRRGLVQPDLDLDGRRATGRRRAPGARTTARRRPSTRG